MASKSEVFESFVTKFGTPEYQVTVPGRVNIIGEHTDYNDGFVLPFTMDRYTWIYAKKSEKLRIYAVDYQEFFEPNIHVKSSWMKYVESILTEISSIANREIRPLKLAFGGNIPIGAGVSSSSAMVCGFVALFNESMNLGLNKGEMISLASKIEHGSGVLGGKMDQTAIFKSQKGNALLLDCKNETTSMVKIPEQWQFYLVNTNVKHELIDSDYNDRRQKMEEVKTLLKRAFKTSLRQITGADLESIKPYFQHTVLEMVQFVLEENQRVKDMVESMKNGEIKGAGKLLYKSHEGLNQKYKVSCEELDFVVEECRNNQDIYGARMMGAGFGGCVLALTMVNTNLERWYSITNRLYENRFGRGLDLIKVRSSNPLIMKNLN
ncbi:MAG TPA: galactokinase family protein [Saprospiraceae bacterium]|nr:galactokinase family protein [Saprospiraceae bacterium]